MALHYLAFKATSKGQLETAGHDDLLGAPVYLYIDDNHGPRQEHEVAKQLPGCLATKAQIGEGMT